MTIDELIKEVEDDVENYRNPPPYMRDEDYERYEAKYWYADAMLEKLRELKKSLIDNVCTCSSS